MNINAFDWSMFWSPVRLSLQVALLSSIAALLIGVAVAWKMSRASFRGRVFLETLLMLPLVLPPTVVGFLLLVLLGRRSLLGRWIEAIFSAPVIFSWWAAVIASIVVAFPLVYQTMKSGFNGVDRDLEDAGRSIGANEWQVFRYITLPLAGRALMTAFILGFARALGEFGATLMIAGNIPGKTQTVPTAIYVAVDSGNQTMAWAWTISIIIISFLMLLMTRQQRDYQKSS
ncbi:molybdate ABC transporter permease subunit [Paenibacillus silvae]|uniref:molybdate ABC transporter permease subunit n=1 Tax=Paenibacillus silvae TaxID=1325358 RepID=UPI00119D7B3F|nr:MULTISPECIES: molybdate ABC transporter permease subunit [Paenibacillus]MCK6076173.1 molybdate ABC transporter permease subunit [Paenibacillus silvae]MCK6150668.1 molybdate ABC transporter permease subunit [Paenibacillus silvae]MCK6268927.1 molybdate ABC transporter permease subunit [Paenibacillus silvae]